MDEKQLDEDEDEDEDEERDYRLMIDRAVGLGHSDPVAPWCESPLRCRPSELQDHLERWASAVAVEVESLTATYWIICRAYPVYPWSGRSDHGLPSAECTVAIPPKVPSCTDCTESMATHNWRFVGPSVPSACECARCGLRREYHEPTSSWPWSWVNYERSGEVDEEERIS